MVGVSAWVECQAGFVVDVLAWVECLTGFQGLEILHALWRCSRGKDCPWRTRRGLEWR